MFMRMPTEGEPGEYQTHNVATASAIVQTKCQRKLCIFDFDHTLKLGSRYDCCGILPSQAKAAVSECLRNGFGIAIASANQNWSFVRDFLRGSLPQFASLLYTEGVQTGQSYKTSSLKRVLKHYNMQANPECSVFFDDLWKNKKYADSVGIPFEKVNPSVGVTVADVKRGMAKVPS
jgi:hypothetical protein